jgi:phage protein D
VLATVDLSKKYSSFIAPKNQILLNQENLQQKYGLTATILTVELTQSSTSKFSFTIDDTQAQWVNTPIFEPNKPIQIHLGYGNTLEVVLSGEVTTIKTVFSSSSASKIEIFGESKLLESNVSQTVFGLEYGKTLLDFTATLTAGNLCCVATSVGLPDIKPGVILALTGLSGKFNMNYLVEKVVHRWDGVYGYRTSFEAKALTRTVKIFRPNI